MTREVNRRSIETALARDPIANLNFVIVQHPAWMRAIFGKREVPYLSYHLWQVAAYLEARVLLRDIAFDVMHHLTFAKYWSPSFLAFLPVPLIWGPVGGGETAPVTFRSSFNFSARVYEALRKMARWLGERDPFVIMTARRSSLVLATTEESRQRLASLRPARLMTYPAIGLPAPEIEQLRTTAFRSNAPLRFSCIGRLVHWKGFHLGLQAFAAARLGGAEFWVIGDGPEMKRLKRLAEDLGISDRVIFHGQLSREQTLKRLSECDILVHPSLHESGGYTCLEAMAMRRPVLCLDLGGPSLQVPDDAGVRVAARDPGQSIAALAASMARLAGDAELRRRMGEAGTNWVMQHYSWDRKASYYESRYEEALAQRLYQWSESIAQ